MRLPKKCVVDTNVPKTANLYLTPEKIAEDLDECVLACVEAIEYIMAKCTLVMDAGDEIFTEYHRQLSLGGVPGLGDKFMKWVHDHRYQWPEADRVPITKLNGSYEEFPDHEGLAVFDPSDRKFIAVAKAHPKSPQVIQATDSKWWGWKDALADAGISVRFICEEYVRKRYQKKMAGH